MISPFFKAKGRDDTLIFSQSLYALDLHDLVDRSLVIQKNVLSRIHVVHIEAVDLALVQKEGDGATRLILVANVHQRKGVNFSFNSSNL